MDEAIGPDRIRRPGLQGTQNSRPSTGRTVDPQPPSDTAKSTSKTNANVNMSLDHGVKEQQHEAAAGEWLPSGSGADYATSQMSSAPPTPGILSRSPSFSGISVTSGEHEAEDMEAVPPLDRLTIFDFLENLALPQRLERFQLSLSAQRERVKRQQERLRSSSKIAREKVVEEWRKRASPDQQLDKYRKRMRDSVDRLSTRWNDTRAVTLREKISFIAGVLNIFLSGYFIGAWPQWFHVWYTAQVAYFYPIRFYTYRRRGFHYFLVDLCYFVNLLLLVSIWILPQSKRLFISAFCLGFGNNAIAIVAWRNSLVFHSLDKVTSLFIHIMPCVTLHCLVHLVPADIQRTRFPAVHTIKTSLPSSPEHYSLFDMCIWASIPYAVWQLSYHFLITVRRREKIAAGRPTSFTWLRRSYSGTWIGKFVLSLPENLQEPAFMCIQYVYALLTMLPAPLWFWSRWASASFLFVVFMWSIFNGANYYIDIFGRRFQKELEQLRKDVAKWQMSPEILARTPVMTPGAMVDADSIGHGQPAPLSLGAAASEGAGISKSAQHSHNRSSSLEGFSLSDAKLASARADGAQTGVTTGASLDSRRQQHQRQSSSDQTTSSSEGLRAR